MSGLAWYISQANYVKYEYNFNDFKFYVNINFLFTHCFLDIGH